MGDRLGFLEPQSLSGEPQQFYKDVVQYFECNVPYVYKLDDGRMVRPFGLELHSPGPGYAWLDMTKGLAKMPGLPLLAREVAILVTGNHEQAAYEIYAHSAVSKLPAADLEEVKQGSCPAHLDGGCHVAFKVATHLNEKPGPLDEDVWKEAVDTFGVTGATALVHYIGFYKYVATILNGFDAQVPKSTQG